MVTKNILVQYSSLQEEIKEVRNRIAQTEKQIQKIEKEGSLLERKPGGVAGISHQIEGFPYLEYNRKKTLLYSRKATLTSLELELMETVNQIEEFIAELDDSRIRRIINLRFIENLSWGKVAARIGGGNTEDSIKKMFYRFMGD